MRNSLAALVNEPWRTKLANARSGADSSITFTHRRSYKHIFLLCLQKCDNGGPVCRKDLNMPTRLTVTVRRLGCALGLVLAGVACTASSAQTTRTIRVVVPAP